MSSASQASAALTAALAAPPALPPKVSPRPSLTSLRSQRSQHSDGAPPVPPRRNALHRAPSLSLSASSSTTGESPRAGGPRSVSSRTTPSTSTARSSYASQDSGKLSLDFGPDFDAPDAAAGKARYAVNEHLEVLARALDRPPPSPGAQFGLGITSDAAVLAAPMPTQTLSAPVLTSSPSSGSSGSFPFGAPSPSLQQPHLGASPLFPNSPFADARPAPPTRSRSSSVAAERARWSTLVGPRFALARTQLTHPSSERSDAATPTPEERDGTVRWSGEASLAELEVPSGASARTVTRLTAQARLICSSAARATPRA